MSEYKGDSNDFNVAFLSSKYMDNSPSQQVPQLKDISYKDIMLDPYLQIVEEPQNRFRFRYRSELNVPHGCIFGQSYVSTNIEIHPMVQLLNYEGEATIRCGLAQIDNEEDHPHEITDQNERISALVPEKGSYRVAFPGLTVIHTPRRDVEKLLATAYCRDNNIENVTPEIRRQCKIDAKRINLNIVRLKFSALDVNTGAEICPPAFSQAINNSKSAATNNLRICRMSRMYGNPRGGDDVFIFVEKVSRNDIQVRFFELSDGEELWSANGRFSRCDVHYQYAIVFSTPPYRDTNITTDVRVQIQLVRPSDDSVSNSMDFIYRGTPHSINRNPGKSSNFSWYEEYRTEYRYLFELPKGGTGGTKQSSSEQSTSTSALQFSPHNFNRMQIEYVDYCKRNNLMPFSFTRHEEQPMEIEPTEQTSQTPETVFSPLVMEKMLQTVLKLFNGLKYLKKPIEIDDTQFMKIRGTLKEILETTLTNGEKFLHMMMLEDLPCFFKHTIKLINSVNLSHLLNLGNVRGQTILHLTTFNNLPFLVIPFLIREGCDPMIGDLAGNNALHYAVMYRNALNILIKTIKRFKVKFDLNAYNEEKRTPLHLVALRGLLPAAYLLLKEGACVNMPDASGRTPLHLAVARDSSGLVAAILRQSKLVDVDAVDGTGYTALHIACENNKNPDIVEVLLKYKADPMKKVDNQTAWKMASKPIRNLMKKYTEKTEASEDTSDEETSLEESVDHSCEETRLRDDKVLMSCDR